MLVVAALLATACSDGGPERADAAAPEAVTDEDETTDRSDEAAEEVGAPPDGAAELAPAPGFDGLAITVGILAPLTGEAAPITGAVTAGQQAYWRYVNERLGGVGARYAVEVRPIDARVDAVAAFERVRDDITVFAHVADGALAAGVVERLRGAGMIASPGSRADRWSDDEAVLPVGVPEPEQVAFARRWLEGEEVDLPAACVVAAGPGAAELVADVTAAGCRAVVLRGDYPATRAVLEAAADAGTTTRWVLLADGWAEPLAGPSLRPYVERRVVVVQERTCAPACAPDRGATGEALADSWFRFGWAQARIVHQVLEQAVETGDLDRETVRAVAARLPAVELDGVLPPWRYDGVEGRAAPDRLAVYEVDASAPGGLAAVS